MLEVKNINRSFKRKIVVAFVVCLAAISSAWLINKVAFTDMLQTVDRLSSPDEKLKAFNRILFRVINLDQVSTTKLASGKQQLQKRVNAETTHLLQSLDSLQVLCMDNPRQVRLIDSISRLLKLRNKALESYLAEREKLVTNKVFVKQIDTLNSLVNEVGNDSIVLSSESNVLTTTIKSTQPEEQPAPRETKGFFAKLFGKKKKETPVPTISEQTRVVEQVRTKVDTLVYAPPDSAKQKAAVIMKNIALKQQAGRRKFEEQEARLANIERSSIAQIIQVLNEAEKDVLLQTRLNSENAKRVVRKNARENSIILMVFCGVAAILIVLILSDVSKSNVYRAQLQLAKEEAEQHSLARQRFLANMSHEIRTPLQSIIGFSQLALQQENTSRTYLQNIYSSSEHLLQIVNEVLDYSRLTAGKIELQQKPFDVYQLVHEVVEALRPLAQAKALAFNAEADAQPGIQVIGDPFRLKQILFNLAGNAIKFTKGGSIQLQVQTHRHKKHSTFTFVVKDTGIGIPTEKLDSIFDQFEQAAPHHDMHTAGTGLGLSIVKWLVEAQQGSIEVNSVEGEGATFTVRLSYQHAHATAAGEAQQNVNPVPLKLGKVWLVDDDQFIGQLCTAIFQQHGIPVTVFASAEALLAHLWDDEVKLIFADIRLSGMDGTALCRLLRKRVGNSVQIVALTAQALPEEISALLTIGFDDVLQKPFKAQQLVHMALDRLQQQNVSPIQNAVPLKSVENVHPDLAGQFTTDQANDTALIETALEENDALQVGFLLHRLAGRTMQMGFGNEGKRLRKLELKVSRLGLSADTTEEIKLSLQQLNSISAATA